jgi:hypothetical protein
MTKTELIKGILEKAEQLKESCGIETVMIIDEMEKLIDTYSEQLNLHNVTRCVLSDKDQAERSMLIVLQQDADRWFSQDEFDRLLALNKKAKQNSGCPHCG